MELSELAGEESGDKHDCQPHVQNPVLTVIQTAEGLFTQCSSLPVCSPHPRETGGLAGTLRLYRLEISKTPRSTCTVKITSGQGGGGSW